MNRAFRNQKRPLREFLQDAPKPYDLTIIAGSGSGEPLGFRRVLKADSHDRHGGATTLYCVRIWVESFDESMPQPRVRATARTTRRGFLCLD